MYQKTNHFTAVNWATLIYLQKKDFRSAKVMLLLFFQLTLLQSTNHIRINASTLSN